MSVYKHQQGSYRSYRVARSIDGELHQAYFPRTREGYRKAKAQDEKWERAQKRAQRKFTGPARRWAPKPASTKRAAASKAGAATKSVSTAKGKTRSASVAAKSAKQPAAAKRAPAKRGPARAPAKARGAGRARSTAKS